MNIIKINGKMSNEERETILVYDNIDKKWHMDTTVLKHYRKAKKQMWTQIREYVDDDNSVCGGVFEAPARAVTIRSTEKKQMTEKQMKNLSSDDDED